MIRPVLLAMAVGVSCAFAPGRSLRPASALAPRRASVNELAESELSAEYYEKLATIPVLRATDGGAEPVDIGSLWKEDDVAAVVLLRSFG